jgi:hypothetical protein
VRQWVEVQAMLRAGSGVNGVAASLRSKSAMASAFVAKVAYMMADHPLAS